MTARTDLQQRDATTDPATLDDDAFWALAASWGFVRPDAIDPDQAWFWTRTWIRGEIEVERNQAAGRFTRYHSDEEFLAALEQIDRDADVRRG